jgi:hypothetical protein
MAKDYKYEDSTPVDEPVRKGRTKAQESGSDIRVDGKPVKGDGMFNVPTAKTPPMSAARSQELMEMYTEKRKGPTSKVNAMGDTYAKGGMTASKRADGCCTKGKTRGKMM